MSDYSLTTEQVRGHFAASPMAPSPREFAHAEFDGWLAKHERQVAAPLEELIEEARENTITGSIPIGLSEVEFYRLRLAYVHGILSRQTPSIN